MTIEVTYNVTDIYISSEVSPIYINVNYQTSGGGAAVWGGITGTLSNQTDLQTALNGKFDDPTGTTAQYIDGTGGLQTFPLTLPVLQEVRNQTGATLAAGTVVYISGATGNKPTVSKAIATGDSTSAQTLGMIQSAIANNGTGYVVVIGTCSGLDTSAYTEGQQLYLSYTTAGAVTTIKPYAPNHLVYVGIVTRSHPTLGTIEVRVQNGYEMDELHNVDAYNPTNNDGLFYNSTTSLWEHKSIGTVLGYNPEQPLTFSSPLSRLVNAVSIPAATSSVNGYLSSTDWSTFNGKENALTFSSPLSRSTNTISIPQATSSVNGFLSSTDWTTFNSKQGALTLTTTGTSGAATLVGNTLNIPQYSGGGISGSGTSGQVTFWNGTSSVTGSSSFQWDGTNILLSDGKGIVIQKTGTNRDAKIYNPSLLDNLPYINFYPNSGTNVGFALQLIPKGTGYNSSIKAQFTIANTDTIADPTNWEAFVMRSTGTSFTLSSGKGGTGTIRPILLSSGFADTSTNPNQLWLYSSNNVGINTSSDAGFRLDVNGTSRHNGQTTLTGSVTASAALAQGVIANPTLVAAANNDVLVGLDVNPTFTNGAFTGVGNTGLRVQSGNTGLSLTTAALTTLHVNQVANTTKGILISGDEIFATGNGSSSTGVRIALGVSRSANRQLWIGDNDAFGSATLGIFRYQTGATGYASLDVVSGNAANRLLTVIGTETSNVGIGNDGLTPNTALYTAKLNTFVFNESRVNILLRKTGTATGDFINAIDNGTTTKFQVLVDGSTILGGGASAGFRLDVNGTARIQSKLSLSAGTTSNAQINLASSTAPTSPANGDIWFDGTDLKMRIGGVTKTFTLI